MWSYESSRADVALVKIARQNVTDWTSVPQVAKTSSRSHCAYICKMWVVCARGLKLRMVSRCRLVALALFWLSQQLSSNGLLLVVSVDAGASTRCRAESVVAWVHLTDLGLLLRAWFCKKMVLAVPCARGEKHVSCLVCGLIGT